jgi:hypothetical protein
MQRKAMEDREDFTESYIHENPEPKTEAPQSRLTKMETDLIKIFIDKNGDIDFGICGTICSLNLDMLNELRQMIPVVIKTYENIWSNENILSSEEEARGIK